jgi:hypothetical protein
MNSDGFDLRRARRALNELVRRSTSADVKSSAEGALGMMTGKGRMRSERSSGRKGETRANYLLL